MSSEVSRICQKNCSVRKGLTLLELVVVIAILAALAGILVPLLPGNHDQDACLDRRNEPGEIAKAVQLYAAQNGDNYPDKLDSIVDPTQRSPLMCSTTQGI